MSYVIGLDGGGTKTQSVLGDLEGNALGRGAAGPCNIAAVSPEDAAEAAVTSIRGACLAAGIADVQIACIDACVAGASALPRREAFLLALQRAYPEALVRVEPDYAAALTGGTAGAPGIVVIAGTGSVAYGEDASGRSARSGAYGYLIDDAGSGYGVGREAIAAALRAADGTGPQTSLTARLLADLGLREPLDLISEVYGGALDRVAIAALSQAVSREAAAGDEAARKILHRAGGALAVLAESVARRLFADEPFVISTAGSLWQSGPFLTDVFARSAARFAPLAAVIPPAMPPEMGALMRGIRYLQSQG
jgi:N-acetylglucosamine kinase-like BadF-type ATPase